MPATTISIYLNPDDWEKYKKDQENLNKVARLALKKEIRKRK